MPLTDTAIRNAKAPPKVSKHSDGGGLQLWVTPAGATLWRLAYRFDGKQRKLSIGAYPGVDLKAAGAAREQAKKHLRNGRDPSEQKRVARTMQQESRAAGGAFLIQLADLQATFGRSVKRPATSA